MKETKFKVGDRVLVYSGGEFRGAVTMVRESDGMLNIESDCGFISICHPKQCRLLKKRKSLVYWVIFNTDGQIVKTFNSYNDAFAFSENWAVITKVKVIK